MRKFLSALMAIVLLVTLGPGPAFAEDESFASHKSGNCSVGDGCSCDCTCTESEGGSFSCDVSKDCPCLKGEGIFDYVTWPLVKLWRFLCADLAALGKAMDQLTFGQNIFNVVALFTLGALMFKN